MCLKLNSFLNNDILDAVAKENSSFTWKSMCGALELVKKGVRWRVGNGQSIHIWKEERIPRDSCLKPITLSISWALRILLSLHLLTRTAVLGMKILLILCFRRSMMHLSLRSLSPYMV